HCRRKFRAPLIGQYRRWKTVPSTDVFLWVGRGYSVCAESDRPPKKLDRTLHAVNACDAVHNGSGEVYQCGDATVPFSNVSVAVKMLSPGRTLARWLMGPVQGDLGILGEASTNIVGPSSLSTE